VIVSMVELIRATSGGIPLRVLERLVFEECLQGDTEGYRDPLQRPDSDLFVSVLQLGQVLAGQLSVICKDHLGHPTINAKVVDAPPDPYADIRCHSSRMAVS
jgi:hypothetical protein